MSYVEPCTWEDKGHKHKIGTHTDPLVAINRDSAMYQLWLQLNTLVQKLKVADTHFQNEIEMRSLAFQLHQQEEEESKKKQQSTQ